MIKKKTKELIRMILPLSTRKYLSVLINQKPWFGAPVRNWWTQELLRDFAETDSSGYHRFLWSHHLAYAESYEADKRFGEENMKGSRKLFFSDLEKYLLNSGIDPHTGVRSVLEVGCSLGYQLHYLETNLFTGASEFEGIDIDNHAITQGNEHLKLLGSKARLHCADMDNINRIMRNKIFDIIICTGVLMYLEEKQAVSVVEKMLNHCRIVLALSGPAYPVQDNCHLGRSVVRERDSSFIHNLDAFVKESGGDVLGRRWEGERVIDGHTIYSVFARKDLSEFSAG
jgi:SAM-dependent methyltransferase